MLSFLLLTNEQIKCEVSAMLTPAQSKLLRYIDAYIKRHGYCPSYDDMVRGTKRKSKGSLAEVLDQLENRGFIRRLANRARAIEVVRMP